jgi:hypothetical protein
MIFYGVESLDIARSQVKWSVPSLSEVKWSKQLPLERAPGRAKGVCAVYLGAGASLAPETYQRCAILPPEGITGRNPEANQGVAVFHLGSIWFGFRR